MVDATHWNTLLWYIGIQISIFGVLFAVIGVIFPIRQERKLKREREELNALKSQIENTERSVKDLIRFKDAYEDYLKNELKRITKESEEFYKQLKKAGFSDESIRNFGKTD